MCSEGSVSVVQFTCIVQIKKFVCVTGGEAKTLLIRGGKRMTKSHYGNAADDMVENYDYDYYFVNENGFEEAERDFAALVEKILKEN